MSLINDIRQHTKVFDPQATFSYGRPFDTALASAKEEVLGYFIHVDPITFGGITDGTESAPVTIGFLKQDSPDSEYDKDQNLDITPSIEELQDAAKIFAVQWLNSFLDTYQYGAANYTITPVTRIKNVMSGVMLSVTFNYKTPC